MTPSGPIDQHRVHRRVERPAFGALVEREGPERPARGGDVLDRYNIAAGQKTEHYEIAAYGNVTSLAGKLGEDEAADLLEETLREEEDALDELSQVGEQFVGNLDAYLGHTRIVLGESSL